MDNQLFQEFMSEDLIRYAPNLMTIFGCFGYKARYSTGISCELPDAAVLGATIDDRFRQKWWEGVFRASLFLIILRAKPVSCSGKIKLRK